MGASEFEWLRHSESRPKAEIRFRRIAFVALALFLGYVAATAAGVPRETSSLIFSLVMLPLPPIVWWAHTRAPADLRSMVGCCAWAATLWLAGSMVWYGFFLANHSEIPPSPGVWDVFFVAARLLLIVAVAVAMRSLLSVRIALLDACVIIAAGISLGAVFIGHASKRTPRSPPSRRSTGLCSASSR